MNTSFVVVDTSLYVMPPSVLQHPTASVEIAPLSILLMLPDSLKLNRSSVLLQDVSVKVSVNDEFIEFTLV